jgi:hypothetical protein
MCRTCLPVFHPLDSFGSTPRESAGSRANLDAGVTSMISGLLATCELLQYDLLETHGVSLRIGPAGQLIVLLVRDNSIAADHGSSIILYFFQTILMMC